MEETTFRMVSVRMQRQGVGRQAGGRPAHLGPLAGLEAAVGVDPEQLAVGAQQVDVQEGLDLALNEVHAARTMNNPVSQCAHARPWRDVKAMRLSNAGIKISKTHGSSVDVVLPSCSTLAATRGA